MLLTQGMISLRFYLSIETKIMHIDLVVVELFLIYVGGKKSVWSRKTLYSLYSLHTAYSLSGAILDLCGGKKICLEPQNIIQFIQLTHSL